MRGMFEAWERSHFERGVSASSAKAGLAWLWPYFWDMLMTVTRVVE